MKKILIPSLAILAAMVTFSCQKIAEVTFSTTVISAKFYINPVAEAGVHTYADQVFNYNLDSAMTANKSSLDHVKKIKVKACNVEILDEGSGISEEMVNAWKSIEWFEAYFTAGNQEIMIASKQPMPMDGSYWIPLNLTGNELIDIIKTSNYHFKGRGSNNAPFNLTLPVKVDIMFEIVGGGKI